MYICICIYIYTHVYVYIYMYIHSCNPFLIKGEVGSSENWVTWGGGVTKFFARKGRSIFKGGVDVEVGGLALFLLGYSSIIFTVCVWESKVRLLLFGSSVF